MKKAAETANRKYRHLYQLKKNARTENCGSKQGTCPGKRTCGSPNFITMTSQENEEKIGHLEPAVGVGSKNSACLQTGFRQKSVIVFCLTLRRLMSYIYGAPILDVSRSHTTTQHSR